MTASLHMGELVRLADRSRPSGFTMADTIAFDGWSRDGRRVSTCRTDEGCFAMLYDRSPVWASWGLIRVGHQVRTWCCVTFRDLGTYSTVVEALAALARHGGPRQRPVQHDATCERVVPFRRPQQVDAGLHARVAL